MPQLIEKTKTELEELKNRFLEHMLINHYSEDTLNRSGYALIDFCRFLNKKGMSRIADVTSDMISQYQTYLREFRLKKTGKPYARESIIGKLQPVKYFFEWLHKTSTILYNPAKDMEIPSMKKGLPRTILNQEEMNKFLSLPDTTTPQGYRDRTMFELLYGTGMRNKELCNLALKNIDLNNKTIIIKGKGNKERMIPLTRIANSYLKEYLRKIRPRLAKAHTNGVVFLNLNGNAFYRSGLCSLIQKYSAQSNIPKPITAHTIRHSIATHLLENGMDIRYIQEFLGHGSLGTTQLYTKVTLKGLRKVYNKHHPKEKRNNNTKIFADKSLQYV